MTSAPKVPLSVDALRFKVRCKVGPASHGEAENGRRPEVVPADPIDPKRLGHGRFRRSPLWNLQDLSDSCPEPPHGRPRRRGGGAGSGPPRLSNPGASRLRIDDRMSLPDRFDAHHSGAGTRVDTALFRRQRPLAPGPQPADRIPDSTPAGAFHSRHSWENITRPSPHDLRLSGSKEGDEPGWTDRRIGRWLHIFLGLGVALRLLRFGLNFPFWSDEAYLASNILERDFVGLVKPLGYAQVCPPLFLWAEKAVSLTIGFSEWSLRLLPVIASVASLILFRHVAGRLLRGVPLALAVAILAVGYSPIRYGGEVKPYATDFLVALGLVALAVEWLRQPERTGFLWGLAALGPLAIGVSNPAVFVAASVGLVMAIPVLRTRSPGSIAALAVFGLGSAATFLVLLRWVNGPQSDHVMPWMRVYWAGAFPPRSPVPLLGWLVRVHTSQMLAYPAGGDHGASTLTTGLVAAAIAAYLRRGSRTVLALLLTPFALGLIAAALGRYPYGGSARTMQYVAPSIILMAGLGAAVLIARLPRPRWRERSPRWALAAMVAVGLGMMAWDVTHPFKHPFFRGSRDLARRIWAEESAGAELLCAGRTLGCRSIPCIGEANVRSCTCATRPSIRRAMPPGNLRSSTA